MQSATRARKPRQAKPVVRKVKLGLAPGASKPGLVTITAGKLIRDYFLWPLASDLGGIAFRLERFTSQRDAEKDEPDHYDILLSPDGHHTCECRGHLRWGTACKHIGAVLKLKELGKL